ncbi:MAG: hypothetical protein QM493_06470 [Sulfurovum sp.]
MFSVDIKKTPFYMIGMEDGMEKGIDKGKKEVFKVSIKAFFSLGQTVEEIATILSLSPNEVEELRK